MSRSDFFAGTQHLRLLTNWRAVKKLSSPNSVLSIAINGMGCSIEPLANRRKAELLNTDTGSPRRKNEILATDSEWIL